MDVKFLNRNIFQRIFGIPVTSKPENPDAWNFSGGTLTIDLKKTPELTRPGGAVRIEGGALPKRVLVVSDEKGGYQAFHNRCTHMGHRRLDPVPGTHTVQCCSISKSTYDLEGKKIFGPAPHPVEKLALRKDGDKLIVTVS
jgi:Rieske Fe-S protein